MASHSAELANVYQLMRHRRLPEAETACRAIIARSPSDGAPVHLLGLIRKESGDLVEGERLLRESIALTPQRAEFHANLANLLKRQARLQDAAESYRAALELDSTHVEARLGLAMTLDDLGKHAAAEAECRTLTAAHPRDTRAWSALALTLQHQSRLAESEAAYRRAIAVEPASAPAHHNLGALLVQMERGDEAVTALERAVALGLRSHEVLFNRGRALSQMYRFDEAEHAYVAALALEPRHFDTHFNLAQLRYMRGDENFARDLATAAAANREDIELQMLFANVMRRVGDVAGAEILLRDVLARCGPLPQVRGVLATVLHESGRLRAAQDEALEACTAEPHNPAMIERLIAIQLSLGEPDQALPFIRSQRIRQPHEQRWIAYEATAARLRGDAFYDQCYDFERLVRCYELEPPSGWSSMEELNAELIRVLSARHRFRSHPFDQSLRNGSQTARSLLTDSDPAIQAVLQAFADCVETYRCEAVGADPTHPLSARNQGPAVMRGAWSIQLHRQGYHVNHIHPQGWISSAYYVSVPPETADPVQRSGWLKFGEPPLPVPGATAQRFVQPHAGRLVLFPSYMWHGTNALHEDVPRLTIAFDAVPGTGR
jgi:Flp pilus assembly protein TadD